MSQPKGFGIMDAVNSGSKDNSVVIRGVTVKAGTFSDLELGPLYEFSQLIEAGQGFKNLSALMPELYASLRAIFGEAITPFWQPETRRLTLHTGEIMVLANLAVEALSANPDYQASNQRVQELGQIASAPPQPAPLSPSPVGLTGISRGQNPREQEMAAQIAAMQQELKEFRARQATTGLLEYTPG